MNNNYKKKPNRFFNKDKNNDKEDRVVYRTKNENKNVLALWQKKLMVISRSLSMDFESEEDRTEYVKKEWEKLGK